LWKENLEEISKEDEARSLINLRYENLERANKYWLEESHRICIFCGKDKNCMEHYVKECRELNDGFMDLEKDEEEIINRM